MKKEIKVKEIFSFNEQIYKQRLSKERNKRIIAILINLLIIACSVFICFRMSNIENTNLLSLGIIVGIIPMICFLILLYQIISLIFFHSDCTNFTDRFYIITRDNRFVLLIFFRDENEVDIEKENQSFIRKIKNNDFDEKDLLECLDIINVHKIKESKNEIMVTCDYNDLIQNKEFKNRTIIVYKCFNNCEMLLSFLNDKKCEDKI